MPKINVNENRLLSGNVDGADDLLDMNDFKSIVFGDELVDVNIFPFFCCRQF
jgi:hypothetical protein